MRVMAENSVSIDIEKIKVRTSPIDLLHQTLDITIALQHKFNDVMYQVFTTSIDTDDKINYIIFNRLCEMIEHFLNDSRLEIKMNLTHEEYMEMFT